MEAQREHDLPGKREDRHVGEAIEQGIQCLKKGESDRAIECFTEAIRLNPECVKAYRLRGQVHDKAGNWCKAERDVAKAKRAEARKQ